MDEVAMAAASALVGAMATDAWGQARERMVALWRRVRPERAEGIGRELEALRGQVVDARAEDDPAELLQGLETVWRARLRTLVGQDPAVAEALRGVLEESLAPALRPNQRAQVYSVLQKTTVHGGTGIVVGGDYHDHRGTTDPKD